VDPRTADAIGKRYHLAEREVLLKGFASPVRAHEVVGLAVA